MVVTRIAGWSLMALFFAVVQSTAGPANPILDAAKRGDVVALRALLPQQPTLVNTPAPDGTTALHWATDRDDLAMADLLIRAGANPKAANRYGVTPLYSAALNANADMIERLLKAGADANTALPEGETALMTAARTGKIDAVRVLLDHGANVNGKEKWKGQSALMLAAHEGYADVVKLLAERGANVNERTAIGFSPILFASRQGQVAAIKALVQAGANVDDMLPDGTSALVVAIQGVNYEAANTLLELGANPNTDRQGWTALHQIVWSRRPQRGQNNPGQKPQGEMSGPDLARKLVEHGAYINARETKEPHMDQEGRNSLNRSGSTPFLLAAKACDLPMMHTLLDLGADPFLATEEGATPLMVAAGVGIFSQGENPGTPEESADAVKLLLSLGADPTTVDKNGDTSLHGEGWRGSNEAVTLLVEAGAKLDARNKLGHLPLTNASGVFRNARVQMNLHTAKLMRELMVARGMNPDELQKGIDANGAYTGDKLIVADQQEAQDPTEVQRKLIERANQEKAAPKKPPQ